MNGFNVKIFIVLFVFSILFFVTRFYDIKYFPHYDVDENFYHELVLNFKNSDLSLYGIKYTFAPHPPLYFLLSIPFISINFISVRYFVVFVNYISFILLFFVAKKLLNIKFAVIVLLVYLFYPLTFYLDRVSYPHALFGTIIITIFLCLLYEKKFWAILLSFFGFVTQYAGIVVIFYLFIYYYFYKSDKDLKYFYLLGFMMLIYMLVAMYLSDGFLFNQIYRQIIARIGEGGGKFD